jgi:hypothetical protein
MDSPLAAPIGQMAGRAAPTATSKGRSRNARTSTLSSHFSQKRHHFACFQADRTEIRDLNPPIRSLEDGDVRKSIGCGKSSIVRHFELLSGQFTSMHDQIEEPARVIVVESTRLIDLRQRRLR